MSTQFSIKSLVELGLTDLESRIYAFLLQNSASTGYGVAKGIGKPTANTYKGLQSLLEKGAIIIEEGETRLYRAVPVKELLNGLESRFKKLKEAAKQELSNLKSPAIDERVYHMTSPEQVIEKFRQMLNNAEKIALLDLFPDIVYELKEEITSAISRGIKVVLKVYAPVSIKNALIIIDPNGTDILKRWPGCWANGVVDGKEHLLALLSKNKQKVYQAVWSGNTYLSWVYHSAMMYELQHTSLLQELQKDNVNIKFPEVYQKLLSLNAQKAPGYRILFERFNNNLK